MTASELMDVHPTDETLAAFLDDRLNKTQRREVIEHLAECGECRTFVNDVSEIKAMDEGNVVPMPTRGGGWRVAAASLAVAAGLVVVFSTHIREWAVGATVKDVATAGEKMSVRPAEARLSIDLPYKAPRSVNRGSAPNEQLYAETLKLHEEGAGDVFDALDALETAKRPDPHAVGLAYLIVRNYDEAIPHLREAAKTNKKANIDLAAALLARRGDDDVKEALELSTGTTPEELWNRAIALGYLKRNQDAIAAWEAYLKADPESEWATEAKTNLGYLR